MVSALNLARLTGRILIGESWLRGGGGGEVGISGVAFILGGERRLFASSLCVFFVYISG